ncbi:aminoglycoside 6'-N-acetyltransferase [Lysobacter antibioticus]|uniref:aminoglycoside 6'-N-acetyltransferase n=1 Tax=Lysobacter antibioticus TaxID=84531 RepID=UPI0003480E81|nr:aminoglycoside 6'-N-acetyltransferase [Lysobacter antibioticus]
MSAARRVRAATAADTAAWSRLRHALWPQATAQQHAAELPELLAQPQRLAAFLIEDEDGRVQGFAEASLRSDYVNGTETSPVGFLEGWYVAPQQRGRGYGRALIEAVEAWTRERGCSELASDAELDHRDSHAAHAACGFAETERVVYFRKRLVD